jgi:uncharacterized membrane protein
LSKNESASSPAIPRIKIRIESLSDLIFGLALSIGSLTLISKPAPNTGAELTVNALLFGFSFLIIVMNWLAYSRTIAVLPIESQSALYLNLVLLFCVALQPYLYYILVSTQSLTQVNFESSAYALDVGTVFVILASLTYILLKEERTLIRESPQKLHPLLVARFKRAMIVQLAVGAVFLLSTLPFFWIPTQFGVIRMDMWGSAFVFFFLLRSGRRKGRQRKRDSGGSNNYGTENKEKGAQGYGA